MTDALPNTPALLCHRNANGRIDALTRQALSAQEIQAGRWEAVAPEDAGVDGFMRDVASQPNALSQTDISMARVLEDLIETLISRGVFQFTDLPAAAQVKLLERRETRAHLPNRLQLLPLDRDHGLL
jgi:hypothetical protein